MPRQAKPGAPGAVCRVGHRDDPGRSDRGLGGDDAEAPADGAVAVGGGVDGGIGVGVAGDGGGAGAGGIGVGGLVSWPVRPRRAGRMPGIKPVPLGRHDLSVLSTLQRASFPATAPPRLAPSCGRR